jgi:hypothetical protein
MTVKWAALGSVFLVSLAIGVGVVVLFTLGVVALGKQDAALRRRSNTMGAKGTAALCFLACGGLVAYGLYLIAA